VQFEWDRKKAANNYRKHKISFDEAVTVFYPQECTKVFDLGDVKDAFSESKAGVHGFG